MREQIIHFDSLADEAFKNNFYQYSASAKFLGHPVPKELHWLKAPERIRVKLAVLTYRCICGTAPTYLSDELLGISGSEPAYDRLWPHRCRPAVHGCRLSATEVFLSPLPAPGTTCRATSASSLSVFRKRTSSGVLFRNCYLVIVDTLIVLFTYLLTYLLTYRTYRVWKRSCYQCVKRATWSTQTFLAHMTLTCIICLWPTGLSGCFSGCRWNAPAPMMTRGRMRIPSDRERPDRPVADNVIFAE